MTPPTPSDGRQPTPSDDMWIELAQFDIRRADGIWDGARTGDDGGPRWRDDLSALVDKARGPATADELAGEAEVVAAMQEARESIHRPRRQVACERTQPGPVGQAGPGGRRGRSIRAAARAAGAGVPDERPVRAVPADTAAPPDPARRPARGRVRLVGRVVVAKGVAAIGAVGFGVAAAAATTGIVASGIVATLVVPDRFDKSPTTTEVPAQWPADTSGPDATSRGLGDGDVRDDRRGSSEEWPPTDSRAQNGRKGEAGAEGRPGLPTGSDAEADEDAPASDDDAVEEGSTSETTPDSEAATDPAESIAPPVTEPAPEESTTTSSSSSTTTTTTTTVPADPGPTGGDPPDPGGGSTMSVGDAGGGCPVGGTPPPQVAEPGACAASSTTAPGLPVPGAPASNATP